jgi:molybdopterin/thiamine biosynthesis adenylyltransferase
MRTESSTATRKVVIVGAGGNIGSHLVSHVARMPEIDWVSLIDRDVYEPSNLRSQDITPGDVGKFKVRVQASRLKRINPSVRVDAIADAVERVPLGRLRADVILACLDSRIARQSLNQYAWRLGVPLIDAGVDPTGLLARINVYVPGPDNPCLECAWDDRDYDALEAAYPCAGFSQDIAATDAPSSLGALAASLQAIECQKFLAGGIDDVAVNKQVLVDALRHNHYVTAFRRNPRCRFVDHQVWQIERLSCSASELTVAEAMTLASASPGLNTSPGLRVEGRPFVKRLSCPNCGNTRSLLRLECSLGETGRRCARCGYAMTAAGFDLAEELALTELGRAPLLRRTLQSLGLRPGEVFTVFDEYGTDRHYELSGN